MIYWQNFLKLSVSDFPTLQGVKKKLSPWLNELNKHVHRKAMLTTGAQSSVWEFLQIINTSDFIILLLLLLLLLLLFYYYYYYHYFILSATPVKNTPAWQMLTDCHRRTNQNYALWEQRISSKAWALSVLCSPSFLSLTSRGVQPFSRGVISETSSRFFNPRALPWVRVGLFQARYQGVEDGEDYEYAQILSSARARTNVVIL